MRTRPRAHRNAVVALAILFGCSGVHEPPGTITSTRQAEEVVAGRAASQLESRRRAGGSKQILFGDLHVHSTFSMDAFALSLPLRGGEGAHPPADACDFARVCSGLDFFSINDHAESITERHWQETKESIRACNATSGDPTNPDLVAFLGWEWTQVGTTPDDHFGHKNVVLLETADDRVPRRPISALRPDFKRLPIPSYARLLMPLADFSNRQRYRDFFYLLDEIAAMPQCPLDVDTLELPLDCQESVATPRELFDRLDRWETPSVVIPHGTTWGLSTPPGTQMASQLGVNHDPLRQTLFEIYSGHGGADEYRSWQAVKRDGDDVFRCPVPSEDYEPCCWRAGEIIRARCEDAQSPECQARVAKARQHYVNAGVAGHQTVPGATVEDWLDCGQCRDCFLPAFDYRPGMSAQYALAEGGKGPGQRMRLGFIGSSDTHSARGGKGYKELLRRKMIDAGLGATFGRGGSGKSQADPESKPIELADLPLDQRRFGERGASFLVGGGLVAVHANGRDRNSIWDAVQAREVYGTSGPRILLWFDVINGPDGTAPMGSELHMAAAPRFRASAVGAQKQTPGCSDASKQLMPAQRIERLCGGECHNPGSEREVIERIEVVRIRPRISPDEHLRDLIDDPWLSEDCPPDPAGCTITFQDQEFPGGSRESIYYVRALQSPTAAINGGGLRCSYDDAGRCVSVSPCYSDERTADDDCLSPAMERAWSSPIFILADTTAPVSAPAS